jgi:prevent-host-death family protein
MILETDTVNFRTNLDAMLSQVEYRRDSIIINKDGKPVAALVDTKLFDRIQRMQDRFQTLCNRIEAGFSTLDTEEGLSEIDKTVVEARYSPRGMQVHTQRKA